LAERENIKAASVDKTVQKGKKAKSEKGGSLFNFIQKKN
jgi:hypothetical protein